MTVLSFTLPTPGSTTNAVADPELVTAFNTILAWANGNVDSSNLSLATAMSAAVNSAGQTVKGATAVTASQSTSSSTYTSLATADQVTGVQVGTNGLVAVWYQATWQESVAGAARAALFIGTHQAVIAPANSGVSLGPVVSETGTNGSVPNQAVALSTIPAGLQSEASTGGNAYNGDVITGQIVGVGSTGGPCYIFLPSGTYTIGVQFKASSGSVTASNRVLRVAGISFA